MNPAATSAVARVAGKGNAASAVTLTVIMVNGTPLVDDIVYTSTGRSVYTLNCSGSFGGH
jgi:hypothetical protein